MKTFLLLFAFTIPAYGQIINPGGGGGGGGAVSSVQGQTGAVVLTAAQVGADISGAAAAVAACSSGTKVIKGVSYSCAYPGATLDVRWNAACGDALAGTNGNTSGKCSMEGESATSTIAAPVSCGSSSGVATCILPATCNWSVNMASTGSAAITWYGGSVLEGPSQSWGPCIISDASSYIGNMLATATGPNGNTYYKGGGFLLKNTGYTQGNGSVMLVPASTDTSQFSHIGIFCGSGDGLQLGNGTGNVGFATNFTDIQSNCNSTGGRPLYIYGSSGGEPVSVNFWGSTFTHAGPGFPEYYCYDTASSKASQVHSYGTYIEIGSGDTTTSPIQSNGCGQMGFFGLQIVNPYSSSATAPGISVSAAYATSLTVQGMTQFAGFTNPSTAILNNATGETIPMDSAGHLSSYTSNLSYSTKLVGNGAAITGLTPSAPPGASAEYPMTEGTGTVVHDISGNNNTANFDTGSAAPSWYTYGVAVNDTGTSPTPHQDIITPLTNFGTVYTAYCTPNLVATTGTAVGGSQQNTYPTLVGPSTNTGGGLLFMGNNFSGNAGTNAVHPTVFGLSGGQITAVSNAYGNCHVYGLSAGATTDLITIDGVQPSSYVSQGASSTHTSLSTGTYVIGAAEASDTFGSRGVYSYAMFYPTAHTAAQMAQTAAYIQYELSLRGTFPKYPILNNSTRTPQAVFLGDSLTASYEGSSQWTTGISLTNSYTVTNLGIGGMLATDFCANFEQRVGPYTVSGQTKIHIWGGTNDIASGYTPAQVAASLAICGQKAKALGMVPILATTISRTGNDTNITALNVIERANWQQWGYAALNDLAAQSVFAAGGYSNSACYQDGVHLTGPGAGTCATINGTALSGYGVVAALTSQVFNALDASTSGYTVASAATIAPLFTMTNPVVTISGTSAISSITPPSGFPSVGCFDVLATGAWTTVAGSSANNTSAAMTAVSGTQYRACRMTDNLWHIK